MRHSRGVKDVTEEEEEKEVNQMEGGRTGTQRMPRIIM